MIRGVVSKATRTAGVLSGRKNNGQSICPIRHGNMVTQQNGETLMGLLVALFLSSIIFMAAFGHFFDTVRRAADHEIMTRARSQSQTILNLLASELRMMGGGMPLGQAGFMINTTGLGDAPLPLMTDATNELINFRVNERGETSILTTAFTPSASTLAFSVDSASDFVSGDSIYISNMTVGGLAGLKATISSVLGNSITLNDDYVATGLTTFQPGSSMARITTVRYQSFSNWSGIVRTADSSSVVLAPQSRMNLEYLNGQGIVLTLPLTAQVVAQDLCAIRLRVWVRDNTPLKDGTVFTAEAEQTIALRNLVINRPL